MDPTDASPLAQKRFRFRSTSRFTLGMLACLLALAGQASSNSRLAAAAGTAWNLKQKVSENKEYLAAKRLQRLHDSQDLRPVEFVPTPALHSQLRYILEQGRNLAIYVPFPVMKFVKPDSSKKQRSSKAYVRGAMPWTPDSKLNLSVVPRVSNWLWVHSEYEMTHYLLERIAREMRIVPTAAEVSKLQTKQ
jgi:hypothetical protein